MILSDSEIHNKVLRFSEQSSSIKPSMTVVRLGFVTSLIKEAQENFIKILKDNNLTLIYDGDTYTIIKTPEDSK